MRNKHEIIIKELSNDYIDQAIEVNWKAYYHNNAFANYIGSKYGAETVRRITTHRFNSIYNSPKSVLIGAVNTDTNKLDVIIQLKDLFYQNKIHQAFTNALINDANISGSIIKELMSLSSGSKFENADEKFECNTYLQPKKSNEVFELVNLSAVLERKVRSLSKLLHSLPLIVHNKGYQHTIMQSTNATVSKYLEKLNCSLVGHGEISAPLASNNKNKAFVSLYYRKITEAYVRAPRQ